MCRNRGRLTVNTVEFYVATLQIVDRLGPPTYLFLSIKYLKTITKAKTFISKTIEVILILTLYLNRFVLPYQGIVTYV